MLISNDILYIIIYIIVHYQNNNKYVRVPININAKLFN